MKNLYYTQCRLTCTVVVLVILCSSAHALSCPELTKSNPDLIWCEDFESESGLMSAFLDFNSAEGQTQLQPLTGFNESNGLVVRWKPGEQEAGGIQLFLNKIPNADPNGYRELYWRFRILHRSPWEGNPFKLTRATVLANERWAQALIGHVWGEGERLCLDPATGIRTTGELATEGYNDFPHLRWLGAKCGNTPFFSAEAANQWRCVEVHIQLNTPGRIDGSFELWIDDEEESTIHDIDWRGEWRERGLNAIFFENYWNGGAPSQRVRVWDDLAVSTKRIGCE